MNEAYEVELKQIQASFIASPVDIVLGIEKQITLTVDQSETLQGFTDVEWQIVYARVLLEDRWFFLPQTLYDEIDDVYGDKIGELLYRLTNTL